MVVYSCRAGAVGTYHMAKKRKRGVDYKWEAIVGLSVGVNWQQGQDNGRGEGDGMDRICEERKERWCV